MFDRLSRINKILHNNKYQTIPKETKKIIVYLKFIFQDDQILLRDFYQLSTEPKNTGLSFLKPKLFKFVMIKTIVTFSLSQPLLAIILKYIGSRLFNSTQMLCLSLDDFNEF